MHTYDVVIIGAGPTGCVCAGILARAGQRVLILEKSDFPRFSIGESFLPQNMPYFDEAGLENAFKKNFQTKDGATFLHGDKFTSIDFSDKSAVGPSETYQVERDRFDTELTQILISRGVEIIFGAEVLSANQHEGIFTIGHKKNNEMKTCRGKFLIDASGFARVLPKLFGHEIIRHEDNRQSFFVHIEMEQQCSYDNKKILIVIDEHDSETWFWLIPLGAHKYSLGLTTSSRSKESHGRDHQASLEYFLKRNPFFYRMLGNFKYLFDVKHLSNYSSSIKKSHGDHYVIVGNSYEFIDPIFSSGVTIGVKSASLAANLILRQYHGHKVDWDIEYVAALMKGVTVFRDFIDYWYQGELQKIFYSPNTNERVRKMIVSILAGYVWDEDNIFNSRTLDRLKTISAYTN